MPQSLDWQILNVPFAAGIDQKSDPRAFQPPALAIAKDVEFDELGGVQTRKPFASMATAIFGGGTLSACRRVVAHGDQLLLFTKDSLYVWNAQLSQWVLNGTYLAAKIEESPRFATTADQTMCDRAELNGTVVYVWSETIDHAGSTTEVGYIAAVDKTTGAVLMAPRDLGKTMRGRLVALSTRILFFRTTAASSALTAYALDPANPSAALDGAATTILAVANMNDHYDAVKIPALDTAIVVCRRDTTTSYSIIKVTAALAVTESTKARTCDGPIAVSVDPTGAEAQVIRGNGTNIQGDLITVSSLADSITGQAIGTGTGTINQIAAAHRSVAVGGEYTCYAFWSSSEATGGAQFSCEYNTVNTAGTIGTAAVFVAQLGVASRAFDHDGRVYVNLSFDGDALAGATGGLRAALQNSYFLYRDDGLLVAKQAAYRAGGHSAATGYLPGVAGSAGVFNWCGIERRAISIGDGQESYAARAPLDITITFDSNEARRTARLGATTYVAGGEIMQFDGAKLTEVGYHSFPWFFTPSVQATGNVEDGVYTYKATYRWDNAAGERDRSTTATHRQLTMAAGPDKFLIASFPGLRTTHKTGIAVEFWRTLKNPTIDAPFYLVTDNDPANVTNPNRYMPLLDTDDPSMLPDFHDELADSDVDTKETNPENGDVLESLCPPAASIIAATADRIFLAGIAGDPNRVWYSKQRGANEVAAFHNALTIDVPLGGGAITALAFLNETLIVFRETAIYALPGDGFTNAGQGQNYGPARTLSADLGAVSHDAVALTPAGLVFKSLKGWYLLNRGWATDYIGSGVADYDSDTVYAVHVVEAQHQIRCMTSGRMLVYDYLVSQWADWTITGGLHAAIWNGTHLYIDIGKANLESTHALASTTYGMDVETAWIKPTGLVENFRVRRIQPIGEWRTDHHLKVRIARDYDSDGAGSWTWFQTQFHALTGKQIGDELVLRFGPSIQRMRAIKIRITAVNASNHSLSPPGAALKLTGLGLEIGIRRGALRLIKATTAPTPT